MVFCQHFIYYLLLKGEQIFLLLTVQTEITSLPIYIYKVNIDSKIAYWQFSFEINWKPIKIYNKQFIINIVLVKNYRKQRYMFSNCAMW
jgi:hypothetical protein